MKEFVRFLKFLVVSVGAGVIQIGSFALMNELIRWSYWPSYLISLILSVVWYLTVNRKVTFKSTANIPVALLKIFAFYAVFTPVTPGYRHTRLSLPTPAHLCAHLDIDDTHAYHCIHPRTSAHTWI